MDVASILIVLALSILTAMFIVRPLVEPGRGDGRDGGRRLSVLKAELEQALALLQELDLDRAMEKIAPEDYAANRSPLVARAAELMREIDTLQSGVGPAAEDRGEDLEAEIEAAVARRRQARSAAATGFCTQCGNPIQVGDRFCVGCGAPVPSLEVGA